MFAGETCLHLALLKGHRTVIAYLISQHVQANINAKVTDSSYQNTIHFPVENTRKHHFENTTAKFRTKVLKTRLFSQDGRSGRTVLHYAVESGDIEAVRFLIQRCGANVNAATFDGSTPLKLALGRGFAAAANLLVQSGAEQCLLTSSEESDSSESDEEVSFSVW